MSDYFKKKFEEARDKYFKGDQVKKIRLSNGDPDDLRFVQFFEGKSGKVYKVKGPEEGITFDRWNAFQKLSVMFGYGASLQEITNSMQKSVDICDSIFLGNGKFNSSHLIHHLGSMVSGLEKGSSSKNSAALYLATIFIIAEDEDETKWSIQVADQKLDDWSNSGYDVIDFLLLARSFSERWAKQLRSERHG